MYLGIIQNKTYKGNPMRKSKFRKNLLLPIVYQTLIRKRNNRYLKDKELTTPVKYFSNTIDSLLITKKVILKIQNNRKVNFFKNLFFFFIAHLFPD